MPMPDYPIMLKLAGQTCVVVGGGKVAARKVRGLLQADASITVISPDAEQSIQELAEQGQILWRRQSYSEGMLRSMRPFLVFAATDSKVVNVMIAEDAREAGALVNVVDGETPGDFSNMAVIERTPITIGLSTDGTSPALLKHIKAAIHELIGDEYAILSQWLGDVREPLKVQIPEQTRRQAIYEAIVESEILALLQHGFVEEAYQHFLQITGLQVYE